MSKLHRFIGTLCAILALTAAQGAQAQANTSFPAQSPGGNVADKAFTQSISAVPAVTCVDNSVIAATSGWATALITVTGTFSGTIGFVMFADRLTVSTRAPMNAFPISGGPAVQSFTSAGNSASSAAFLASVAGNNKICAYFQTYTSGTATISMELSVIASAQLAGNGSTAAQAQGGPFGFPMPGNIQQVGGENWLFGPGPSLTAFGVAPRVSVANDQDAVQRYRCAATFTPLVTSAVTLFQVTGSATKTVHVTKVMLSSHATGNTEFWGGLQRTSALGSGGTAVLPTIASLDSRGGGGGATATCTHYTTGAQTAGTAVGGPITASEFTSNVITTSTVANPPVAVFPEIATLSGTVVLRGSSDFLEFQNKNAGSLGAGTVVSYSVEFFEDSN